jgi:transcriptional regulator with XRE-family HTH domain
MKTRNAIGPQVHRLRTAANITQDEFAARCGVLGWRLSRSTVAKIESQVRCVSDAEVFVLARALRTEIDHLYPSNCAAILRHLTHSD